MTDYIAIHPGATSLVHPRFALWGALFMEPGLTINDQPNHGPAEPLPDISDADLAAAPSPPPQSWYDEKWEHGLTVGDGVIPLTVGPESTFVRDCQAEIKRPRCKECSELLGERYVVDKGVTYCMTCASVGADA